MPLRGPLMQSGASALFASNICGTGGGAKASAGTNQATALVLLEAFNVLKPVVAGTGVQLLAGLNIGESQTVVNAGVNNLLVYPPLGGSIGEAAVNAPVTILPGFSNDFKLAQVPDQFFCNAIDAGDQLRADLATPPPNDGADLVAFQQPEANSFPTTLYLRGRDELTAYDFMSKAKAAACRARANVTDVTTELNNAVAAVVAEGRKLLLPYGIYAKSGPINVGLGFGWRIRGEAVYGSSIIDHALGAGGSPIFRFTKEVTHSWGISDLYAAYQAQQVSTQIASVMIYVDPDTTNNEGTFQFALRDCNFDYGYAMVGNNVATQSVYDGLIVDGCWCLSNVVGGFIYAQPLASTGQPRFTLGTNYCTSPKLTRPAIDINGCDSLVIQNFECNQLTDQSILRMTGGGVLVAGCIRSESEVRSAASANTALITGDNQHISIGALVQSITTLNLGANARMFVTSLGGAACDADIDYISLGCITNTSGSVLVSSSTRKSAQLRIKGFPNGLAPPFYFSDIGSSGGSDFAQVADWANGAISFSNGDADKTMAVGDATTQLWANPLTARRRCTLPPVSVAVGTLTLANITGGLRYYIFRPASATGASLLDIYSAEGALLASLSAGQGQWVAWNRLSFGWLLVT